MSPNSLSSHTLQCGSCEQQIDDTTRLLHTEKNTRHVPKDRKTHISFVCMVEHSERCHLSILQMNQTEECAVKRVFVEMIW